MLVIELHGPDRGLVKGWGYGADGSGFLGHSQLMK
jgi:hypothetical protein